MDGDLDDAGIFMGPSVAIKDAFSRVNFFSEKKEKPGQTSYLSLISLRLLVEKNCHVENFQLSMYDNCGEIEHFSTRGEISS